jgi:AraC family transcriptional regulator of adaptative response / DNA-3-methyladenine glycosylase II
VPLESAGPIASAGDPVQLDEQTCEQARLNRDARFDGRIFIGVTSTGIYCRPVCPSPHAKRAHVRYFPTAAAAACAGFRPCLRCRPEVAPGTPAWNGTSATVSRGLRLIAEGALDEDGIERLAERLGVTSRHLSRLFLRHLGALPTTIARVRRLHFAKQLISDTRLPMAQVALASGFGSIRRFNDVFREYYGRPPSELRRLGGRHEAAEHEYVFQLAYRPPYAWSALLDFLAARTIPRVESVRDGMYRRVIALRDCQGLLEVRQLSAAHALRVRLRLPRPEHLLQVISRVRSMFDLAADPQIIEQALRRDRLLRPLLRRYPGLRLPGAWDPLEIVVGSILAEDASPGERTARMAQLAARYGRPLAIAGGGELSQAFPEAATLACAELADVPARAARAIRATARILRAAAPAQPLDELLARLEGVEGLDGSCRQLVAMRCLNDPDVLPLADRSLARGYQSIGSTAPLTVHAESWKPWRGYAAMYLMCASADARAEPTRCDTARDEPGDAHVDSPSPAPVHRRDRRAESARRRGRLEQP